MLRPRAKTDDPIWRVLAPFSTASPAVANGKLFFGMGVGDFIYDAAGLRAIKEKELQDAHKSQAEIDAALKELPDAGELWCIDVKTHNVDWKFDIGQTVLGTPRRSMRIGCMLGRTTGCCTAFRPKGRPN